ncbi:hypothetical protein NX779_02995 [Mycoplasma cottewii]|uniref:Uncharacterized protein n=1 Tax=Mycoplasma cottewii TaxID=51364 RepID=A0ABY5TVT3_9MOLU|nr:hypothetical protein [Mycoplasma cottewii]UWD34757.1 hypothetical protein NX779_02995 [Mycoplasma cottewii]
MKQKLIIGKIYKQRYKNNKIPIARNKDGSIIMGNGIHRPFIVFFSDDKVYYLATKTVKVKNKRKTSTDPQNLTLETDLYGKDDRTISVNCSVINVMERKLFESLYILDDERNDFQTDPDTYNKIMKHLFKHKDDLSISEFDYFDFENKEPIFKTDEIANRNRQEVEMIIVGYNHLINETHIIPELILDKPDHFYEVVKECFYVSKYGAQDELSEAYYKKNSKFDELTANSIWDTKKFIDDFNKEWERKLQLEQEKYDERQKEAEEKEQQEIEELLELLKTPEQPKNNNQQESQNHHLDNEDDETYTPKPTQSLKLTM